MTITEKHNRNVLIEGRSSGMGFAMLKKDKTNYETVNPLSPCKDYLNEVVFTENTGYPTKAHGLDYKEKLDIFKNKVYMAIKIISSKGGGSYFYGKTQAEDEALLVKNYKKIQKLVNFVEENLNIKGRTIITKANDGYFLVKGPLDWRKSTIMISLYSLLIRCGLAYDGKTEPMKYLENYSYNNMDKGLINPSLPKIKRMFETKQLPEQPEYNEEMLKKGTWTPHNIGIISYTIK